MRYVVSYMYEYFFHPAYDTIRHQGEERHQKELHQTRNDAYTKHAHTHTHTHTSTTQAQHKHKHKHNTTQATSTDKEDNMSEQRSERSDGASRAANACS